MSYKPKRAPDQPAANDPQYRDAVKRYETTELDDVQTTIGVIDGLRERIAELEQKAAADREYMDKAEKRIAELEARSAKDFADWEEAAAKAEALLNKAIAELEAELAALRANRDELIRMVDILKAARAEEGGGDE